MIRTKKGFIGEQLRSVDGSIPERLFHRLPMSGKCVASCKKSRLRIGSGTIVGVSRESATERRHRAVNPLNLIRIVPAEGTMSRSHLNTFFQFDITRAPGLLARVPGLRHDA